MNDMETVRKPLEIAHASSSHHDAVDLVLDGILAHLLWGLAAHAERVHVRVSHIGSSLLHLRELLLGLLLQLFVDSNIVRIGYV